MSLFALKALVAGSVGVGMVAIPVSTLSFISRGSGRMVYMIAEGPQGLVKLFVAKENQIPEKPETAERNRAPKYKIEAWYKGKPVKEKLMLCSPEETKQNYWLLKQESGGYYQQNLNGVWGSKICDSMRDANGLDSMSKLSIKVVTTTSSSTGLPKTIVLDSYTITSTSVQQRETNETNPDKLKITCTCKDASKQTTVEITTQEFKELS